MKDELIRLADKLIVAQCMALVALVRRFTQVRVANVEPPTSWVVIKLVGMGDAVLMLPILAAIRAQSPQRLVVVTTGRCAAVFSAPGVADEVVILGRTHLLTRLRALWTAMRSCDRVVDFEQHIFWSSALSLLARRRARLFGFHTRSRRRNLAYDGAVVHERDLRRVGAARRGYAAARLNAASCAPRPRRQGRVLDCRERSKKGRIPGGRARFGRRRRVPAPDRRSVGGNPRPTAPGPCDCARRHPQRGKAHRPNS